MELYLHWFDGSASYPLLRAATSPGTPVNFSPRPLSSTAWPLTATEAVSQKKDSWPISGESSEVRAGLVSPDLGLCPRPRSLPHEAHRQDAWPVTRLTQELLDRVPVPASMAAPAGGLKAKNFGGLGGQSPPNRSAAEHPQNCAVNQRRGPGLSFIRRLNGPFCAFPLRATIAMNMKRPIVSGTKPPSLGRLS